MSGTLTINQEKQLRELRRTRANQITLASDRDPNPEGFRSHDLGRELLPHYERLAAAVKKYRKLSGSKKADDNLDRIRLLGIIDECLAKLGL